MNGADLLGLTPVGAVAGYSRSADGITVKCSDQSEVQLQVMASDLIRVRAAFGKALPERDHSWAISDAMWTTPEWSVKEDSRGGLLLITAELEVAIGKPPLLIEFRDAKRVG